MSAVDSIRLDRQEMKSAKLDALVCRLSENVVYLTDYGPHHGFSVVVLPRASLEWLLVPEVEREYVGGAAARNLAFRLGRSERSDEITEADLFLASSGSFRCTARAPGIDGQLSIRK